ncbi:hypothetical protein CQW23_25227 [Capsicum baccatum]|uniref:F-box domain-containing protein n=1 Tax=Capsicum baccatum TaxID=33114 RepID=A0A2G2VKD9_CAPBA|nr:hypothetical protein CQW23_25227 [Capsicum baccatum]
MAPFEALYEMSCRSLIGSYEVGRTRLFRPDLVHQVMEKVSPMKGVMRFGKKWKLSPCYIGPYHITKTISGVAYELELPAILTSIRPVFHVLMLKKCIGDQQVRRLRTKEIASVKVLWKNRKVEEATWESENDMSARYPSIFEFADDVMEYGHFLFPAPYITIRGPYLNPINSLPVHEMEHNFFNVPILSNPMLSEVTIMDLLRVIMVEVLARLPIKSIFRCKIVCKSWYHLLTSDPLFVKKYQKRSFSFPSILLWVNDSARFIVELKDENDSQSLYRNIELRPMIHLPSHNKENLTLVGSCNGFMCLLNGWKNNVDNSVYISNPLLSEYFKVELPEWEKSFWNIVYGFGFSEASGQYKVLRFKLAAKNFWGRPKASDLEVYTLGVDEKWRNAGEVPEPLWQSFNNVNVNGAVHWMDCEKNDIIYSFNISTEEVNSLSAPHGLEISILLLNASRVGELSLFV